MVILLVLVTVQQDLNNLRYPLPPKIRREKKPLEKIDLEVFALKEDIVYVRMTTLEILLTFKTTGEVLSVGIWNGKRGILRDTYFRVIPLFIL